MFGGIKCHSQVFTYNYNIGWCYKIDDNNYNVLKFPEEDLPKDVIVIIHRGGGNGFEIFKTLSLSDNLKTHCNNKFLLLPKTYLGIQIRNMDYKCDYVELYETNKEIIHSYKTIYIATDCTEAIVFFKKACINSVVLNFAILTNSGEKNLHGCSTIDGDTKIKDLMCDIYMITMWDKFITNSKGGFVHLLKQCHKNDLVKRMFLDI